MTWKVSVMCFTNFSSKHTLHTFFGDVKDFPKKSQAFIVMRLFSQFCQIYDLKSKVWSSQVSVLLCSQLPQGPGVLVWLRSSWLEIVVGVVLAGFPTNIFLDDPQWFQLFTHIASIRFFAAMRFFSQSFDLYHYQSHNYVGFSFPCRLCLLQILAFCICVSL